jgi:hypothetical protein
MCPFIAILTLSYWSDKVEARGPLLAAGCVLPISGYIMLLAAKDPAVKYGGTFLIAVGVILALQCRFPILVSLLLSLRNPLAAHQITVFLQGQRLARK